MIKRLLTLSFISASLIAGAQTQPNNPGFETWSGGYPANWGSIDQAASAIIGNQGSVTQSATSYTGSSAVSLQPKHVGTPFNIDVPAIIVTGQFEVTVVPVSVAISGTPYTSRPTTMSFYYTYAPSGGDTAAAAIWLYKYNATTHARDTMAYGEMLIPTATGSYTLGTVNLNYYNTAAPDSMALVFTATLNQLTVGTVMKVDEVSISGTASGLEENAKDNGVFVYPNPANGNVNFTVARNADVKYMEIYDLNGRVLNTVSVQFNTTSTISTSTMADGMYFYSTFNANGVKTYSGKFQVQH